MSSSASPNGSEAAQGNGTVAAAEDFSVYLLNQVRYIYISGAEVDNCFTNKIVIPQIFPKLN